MTEDDNDNTMEMDIGLARDSVAVLFDGVISKLNHADAIQMSLCIYKTFRRCNGVNGDGAYCTTRFHRFIAEDAHLLDPWMATETRARFLAHPDVPTICFRTCVLFMCAATHFSYRERHDGFYHTFYLPQWVVRAVVYGGSEYDAAKSLVDQFNCGIEIKHGKTCCLC